MSDNSAQAVPLTQHIATGDMRRHLARLLMARALQQQHQLRQRVQAAALQHTLTPETIAAFAALHIVDDQDLPITPAAHHGLWLQLMCDENIQKLLIIAPPESAKTTWTLQAFTSCYVGVYPERNVIIAGSSGDVARRRSLAIRTMVESEAWRATFPGVVPAAGLTWEQTEWSLAPDGIPKPGRIHPTLSAYGTGGPIIGARADLLIADDILDFANTRTAHLRAVVWEWFHNTFLSRLKPHGRCIVIGTAWTHDDVYAKLRKRGDFVVCHLPLLSPTEDVYAYLTYPDDWPFETLGAPLGQPVEDLLNATRKEVMSA